MRARYEQDRLVIDVESEADMDRLGFVIAGDLHCGDVFGLDGPLGAGKTRLTRAIIASLDCDQMWSGSPTFILVQEYLGALPVYHIDAYRLKDVDEFRDLGGDDYLWGDGVCIIEWAERIEEALAGDVLRIRIEVVTENSRRVEMSPGGPRSTILLASISHAVE